MNTPTPTNPLLDTARSILAIHQGTCSVLVHSPIGETFLELASAGEVSISDGGTAGFINVSYRDHDFE